MTEDEELLQNQVSLEILKVIGREVEARDFYRHGNGFRALTQFEQVAYLVITNALLERANEMADKTLASLGVRVDGHDLDEKLGEVVQMFDVNRRRVR